MSERGPVPKRTSQRRRRNKPDGEVTSALTGSAPDIPPTNSEWHPAAARWYAALQESGQSQFYEASDWATAYYVAEAMSRNLHQGRFSAQLFQAVMSGMTELLTTEGARRRARLELERAGSEDEDETAAVTAMAEYRKRLGS